MAPHPMGTNLPWLQGVRIVRHMNQQVLASGDSGVFQVFHLPSRGILYQIYQLGQLDADQKHQHLQAMPAEPARSTSRLRSKSSPATDLAHHEANQREMVAPTRHVTVKLQTAVMEHNYHLQLHQLHLWGHSFTNEY